MPRNDPLATIGTRRTPQNQRAAPHQTRNNAGGFGFQVSDETLIHRFLTIGTAGGTYYVNERDLTLAAGHVVLRAARERGTWLVEQIRAVSQAGRAPRQNPAILALAACAGLADDDGRRAALAALPDVCRTGSHLLTFAGYVEQFRGWGTGLKRAVGNWYLGRDLDNLAYQMVKYRQRDGWAQRDLLRLSHPATNDEARNALLRWVAHGEVGDATPRLVHGFVAAHNATTSAEWVKILDEHRLPWEALPDAALTDPAVWRHLLIGRDGPTTGLPQTALLRQLPRITRLGLFDDREVRYRVTAQLTNADILKRARVHPFNVLVGMRTYASGRSLRGSTNWTPHPDIIDALDAAFYRAFDALEPTGKRTLLALDVSGSMGTPAGGLPVSCREASVAIALATMHTEPDTTLVGFTAGSYDRRRGWGYAMNAALTQLPISPRQRLDDAVSAVSNLPFGATDCSLPARWAKDNGHDFDTVVIYTDSETWAGVDGHPHQALNAYRDHIGHEVRQVVVGMTATDISIADPHDRHSLDIAGLDSSVPNLIADFSRGEV